MGREKGIPLIAVTMGDPAGIGPEIVIKAYREGEFEGLCRLLVIGDLDFLRYTADRLGIDIPLQGIEVGRLEEAGPLTERLAVLDLKNVDYRNLVLGQVSPLAGKAAAEYILKAVELAMAKKVKAIVTAPINKEALNRAGYNYPGHTEWLAKLTDTSDYAMMMVGGGLRVVLVTTHIPLREVVSALTVERVLRVIRLTQRAMGLFDIERPKLALAALNPHGGEGGLFGEEEREILIPAIEEACREGIDVSGPYPADTLFQPRKSKSFHAIIAMYHDQGLIPVKNAAFGRAVNVTIGLPIIRTSVDHGTAYDIAGKGVADPGSLIEAIKLSASMRLRPC